MNWWAILGIVIAVIAFITGGAMWVNDYIDTQIETQYQTRVAEFMLEQQNQAIKDAEVAKEAYNASLETKQTEIKAKVEYIQVKDETCEAKLQAIQELINVVHK